MKALSTGKRPMPKRPLALGKLNELAQHRGDDWTHWDLVIKGWRALRAIACNKAGTNNMASQAYRDAMGELLTLKKYAAYNSLDKQTRSNMYKLCDNIEEVTAWYFSDKVSDADRSRWKHPDTIAKHCPQNLLAGFGKNKPRAASGKPVKKRGSSAEEDRLRQLLLKAANALKPHNPSLAAELFENLYPVGAGEPDPDDGFEGLPSGLDGGEISKTNSHAAELGDQFVQSGQTEHPGE
jgi:hypothetical protein